MIFHNRIFKLFSWFFRVEGKGEATVLDVIFEKRRVLTSETNSTEKVKQLQSELNDLESQEKVLALKNQRY